jgi:hypothetical protein
MNPLLIFQLIEALLPSLIADGGKAINDIAHGEGGIGKVGKVLGDIGALTGHAAAAVAAATVAKV